MPAALFLGGSSCCARVDPAPLPQARTASQKEKKYKGGQNEPGVGMGRMHTPGKGISGSTLSYCRRPPAWQKARRDDLNETVCMLAKKGHTPSQIGTILRDHHGIGQSKRITGSKILRILKINGLAPEIPEDLFHLIKKAVAIRKHMERNRKDMDSKYRLILVESRVHRLGRYYKLSKQLPPAWKYTPASASALVS